MTATVAALFVSRTGPYWRDPRCDPWDDKRDARNYLGPLPVVAHPPCARWCMLARLVEARYGYRVGDDGECFAHALAAVETWGGVLEHPSGSLAWARYGLVRPRRGVWLPSGDGWTTSVSQVAYGHPCRKRTWLYYVGEAEPPALDWSEPRPTHQVGYCRNRGATALPGCGRNLSSRTAPRFAELLISLALA